MNINIKNGQNFFNKFSYNQIPATRIFSPTSLGYYQIYVFTVSVFIRYFTPFSGEQAIFSSYYLANNSKLSFTINTTGYTVSNFNVYLMHTSGKPAFTWIPSLTPIMTTGFYIASIKIKIVRCVGASCICPPLLLLQIYDYSSFSWSSVYSQNIT